MASCDEFPTLENCICTKPGLTRLSTTAERLYEFTGDPIYRYTTQNYHFCCGDMLMGGIEQNYDLPYLNYEICTELGWIPDQFQSNLRNCHQELYRRFHDPNEDWNESRPLFQYQSYNHIECPKHRAVTKVEVLGRVSYICVYKDQARGGIYKPGAAGLIEYTNIYSSLDNDPPCQRASGSGSVPDLCRGDLTNLTPRGNDFNPVCMIGNNWRCGTCPDYYSCIEGICEFDPSLPGAPDTPPDENDETDTEDDEEPEEEEEEINWTVIYLLIGIIVLLILIIIGVGAYLL